MPINNLTKRGSVQPPRLGIIRKGDLKQEREKDGRKYEVVGRDRDSFRVVFDSQYKAFEPLFTEMYTSAPVEFRNIMLLGDTPDSIFEAWYEEHMSAKLLHRCDGEQQVSRFVNGENVRDGAACENKKLHPDTVKDKGCNCSERGWLRIVLMDFTIASGVWGYFQVETGSIYDIIALSTYLQFIDNIQSLRGLRFVLGRAPKMVNARDPKDPNKRSRREMNLLYLMVEPEQTKQYLVNAVNQRDQMALSGQVNVVTGELANGQTALPARVAADEPFVPAQYQFDATDIDPMNDWDMSAVEDATSHLFDHPAHQQNALHKMMQESVLLPTMTTEEAIAAIKKNRADRRNEKLDDGTWWLDKELVSAFCQSVNMVVPSMGGGDILRALNTSRSVNPASKLSEFKGMRRAHAWALCLLFSVEGNYSEARARANDPEIIAYLNDMETQTWESSHSALPEGDIPF